MGTVCVLQSLIPLSWQYPHVMHVLLMFDLDLLVRYELPIGLELKLNIHLH